MSIESSLVSGCGQGHESPEFASIKAVASSANSKQKWKFSLSKVVAEKL